MTAHHGQTPAAWTGVTIALVAFLIGAVGMVTELWVLFWVGLVLLLLSPVVGGVMSRMGMGADPR
jgi:multisubunit Na+/H+ antiporter MnhG subunit